MCGIAGFLHYAGTDSASHVTRMAEALAHRGPDDAGYWVDEAAGVALAHRRLAILDLSPAGHQPMVSAGGRYVIVFNGEIYNHLAIRKELESAGHAPEWRGHSDTETILAASEHWGIETALKRFVGMFAFGLWDRSERILYLARDRLGEKPLYYGWSNGSLLFGSELKALRAFPGFHAEIDRGALALFMRYSYVPEPLSIFTGIRKLIPGTYVAISASHRGTLPKPMAYWSARSVAEEGTRNPVRCEAEAVEQLDRVLRDAVAGQMISDVPLGAFLSGGIDSSTVVALMQAQSDRPVKTFTIGFHERGYNEATYARTVARHLGTDHTEIYVTPDEAMAVIPRLPTLYDEPFADSSQIPTFLVAQLARRDVTVSLSGDGGDELFGGYNRYFWGQRAWRRIGAVPRAGRATAASLIRSLSPETWDAIYRRVEPLIPKRLRVGRPGANLHKLADAMGVHGPEELYIRLVSHWESPASIASGSREPPTIVTDRAQWPSLPSAWEHMMYLDLVTYLPGDILVKVDRAAMGVSLETRVPMLDHRVVEFAWRVPLKWKIRDGQGKWLLRQVLYKYLPHELVERPKMGFGVPVDSWLRGPLREWAAALLAPERLRREGFFDPAPINEKWQQHQSGAQNWSYHLWDVLMFQAWIEAQYAQPDAARNFDDGSQRPILAAS